MNGIHTPSHSVCTTGLYVPMNELMNTTALRLLPATVLRGNTDRMALWGAIQAGQGNGADGESTTNP